jgi:hypothetical protein
VGHRKRDGGPHRRLVEEAERVRSRAPRRVLVVARQVVVRDEPRRVDEADLRLAHQLDDALGEPVCITSSCVLDEMNSIGASGLRTTRLSRR